MVGIDLNLANIELTSGVFDDLKASEVHDLSKDWLRLIHAAGGAQSAVLRIPKCPAGFEICRIPDNASSLSDSEWTMAAGGVEPIFVPVVTIDEVVKNLTRSSWRHYHAANASKTFTSLVDVLMIDTEGHDAMVLRGAKHLIKKQAVRCIIFEYHSLEPWKSMRLEDTIRELDIHGYECFFQGNERLWPLSGHCWNEAYEFHSWSNVMCVARNDVWMASILPFIVNENYIDKFRRDRADFEGRTIMVSPAPDLPLLDPKQIYLVKNGTKHPFFNANAFTSRGFSWTDTRFVSAEFAAFLAEGEWLK